MKPMKTVVIGCGAIGTAHSEHYAATPNAELTYLVDIIPERARALAEKHGAPYAIEDYKQALADPEVDAVSVCLPNDLHCPVTVDALNAGKHVMCEKPPALTVAEAEKMREAARKNGKLLVIAVVNRFNTSVLHVRDIVQSGKIGRVYHVSVTFKGYRGIPGLGGWFTTKARSGGGVMIDIGVHYLDLTMFILGIPALKSLSGVAHSELARDIRKYAFPGGMWAGPPDLNGTYDVEEFASGLIRTEGPSIFFEGAWAQNVEEGGGFINFLGDKGGVHLRYGGPYTIYTDEKGVLYKTSASFQGGNMFRDEIDSFLECAHSGKPSPQDIDTVLPTQRILDGLYRSAAEGREVSL